MRSNIRHVISFAIACVGALATASLVLPATAGTNSWTAIGPVTDQFAVDPSSPSTIYAVVNGNTVTKTTDGGGHWADLAKLELVNPVYSLVIDPSSPATIYVAGGDIWDYSYYPIYKSIDGGVHWVAGPNGADAAVDVLAVAPSMSSTLYAGEGIFVSKSVDGGLSWARGGDGTTGWIATALAIDPTNADVVYVAQRVPVPPVQEVGKVFKSSDGGTQWRELPISVPFETAITSLAIDPVTPSIVYAAASNGGVFKSIDSGETWFAVQNGLSETHGIAALAIDPSAPARIYAATRNGVFRSADAAASWTPINSGLTSLDVWSISIDRTGSILRAATANGLFEYVFEPPALGTVPVVEYQYPTLDHYFITANPDEIRTLDNGTFPGWVRTGLQFNAYSAPNVNSVPVCRFFGVAPNSAHFFTPFATECASTQADARWMLETTDAFDIALPAADGSCAAGMTPVYRLYNNGQGGASGHRYTTDAGVRAQMIGRGWVAEGLGADAVEMCSPL